MATTKNPNENLISYTSEVEPEKTVGEILSLLLTKDASRISIDKVKDGFPIALRFSFPFPGLQGQYVDYKLVCNWQGCHDVLKAKKNIDSRYRTEAQARRTAWRIILGWVRFQIGMCELQQGQIEQMFFSHAIDTSKGHDEFIAVQLFEYRQKQLGTGGESDGGG